MSQASVKQALIQTIDNLKENPSASSVAFRSKTKWKGDTLCSVKIRQFPTFDIDEPPELGGQDSAPNPVELVLAALGTCQEIMYSAYAAVMDIALESVEVDVRGYLDLKGLLGMDENVPAGYKRIIFETRINSNSNDEKLLELIHTVENHCPVMDILTRPQSISGSVIVNGKKSVTFSK